MAKHNRNKAKDLTCPECKGSGRCLQEGGLPNEPKVTCWYCLGTGITSEEPTEEKDWERY